MGQKISLTDDLRAEYERLYASSTIRPERQAEVARVARKMDEAWPRYEEVASSLSCPAHLVGLIHAMECGLNFGRHLHNGDPLTARTTHVPAGRPIAGQPPFSWEESACDALIMRRVNKWTDWSLAGLCYVLEGYNGFGYRLHHPEVLSPYLWSYTTAYTRGKYVADGTWSATAVSKQCGAMALLKSLIEIGYPFSATIQSPASSSPVVAESHPWPGVILRLGSTGGLVEMLQERLAALGHNPGPVDGLFWRRTNDAVRQFQASQGLVADGAVGPKTWAALWGQE